MIRLLARVSRLLFFYFFSYISSTLEYIFSIFFGRVDVGASVPASVLALVGCCSPMPFVSGWVTGFAILTKPKSRSAHQCGAGLEWGLCLRRGLGLAYSHFECAQVFSGVPPLVGKAPSAMWLGLSILL